MAKILVSNLTGLFKQEHHLNMELNCKSLDLSFADRGILKNFNWKLASQSQVWLKGPSGSGKSSLLSLLAGLGASELQDSTNATVTGEIFWGECRIDLISSSSNAIFRRKNLCYVHQENHLINHWTIAQNLELFDQENTQNGFARLIEKFGLGHLKDSTLVQNLSGGERQRLNLLRVVLDPKPIVLLDEPTAHLDDSLTEVCMTEIKRACAKSTLLIVSHDNRMQKLGLEVKDFNRVGLK